jgi:hypothetical protein
MWFPPTLAALDKRESATFPPWRFPFSTIGHRRNTSRGPLAKRALPTETSRLRAQHITAINRAGNLINQGIHALHVIELRAPALDQVNLWWIKANSLVRLYKGVIPMWLPAAEVFGLA